MTTILPEPYPFSPRYTFYAFLLFSFYIFILDHVSPFAINTDPPISPDIHSCVYMQMANLAHADLSEDDKIKAMMNQSTYDSMRWVIFIMLSNLHPHFCLLSTSVHLLFPFSSILRPCCDLSLGFHYFAPSASHIRFLFLSLIYLFFCSFFHELSVIRRFFVSIFFYTPLIHSVFSLCSYTKKFGGVLPVNYTCYRCGNTGHHIRNCPTSGVRAGHVTSL